MGYTPSFTPQYENGWEDLPSETSPITAEALNAYDDAIENIEEYLASDESQGNLADAYDETETYAVGDYVIYSGDLYKCTTAISTAEEWDSTHWTPCLITNEMGHGGGGSSVTITPTLSTGTKIADFEIDGQTGELYAPTGGGGNANIWTGTQAELEEVFDELEEGTQINITDDEQEVVEGGTIYSEEEQVIGLWTDNKPLYQRTYNFSNVTLSQYGIADIATLSNIDHIHVLNANCVESSIMYDIAEYGMRIQFTADNKLRLQCTVGSWEDASGNVTVQYTKSTDAPIDAVVGKSTMYIASSDCYSTEEKEIGCWKDGKPLYQRVFDLGSDVAIVNNTFTNTTIDASSMETLVDAKAIYSTGVTRYNVMANIGNGVIRLQADRNDAGINARYIVLQYTKTTDTAGSGQYTPASGKAVHYSTDEQVIGTWIDGSTLYRKTYQVTSPSTINQSANVADVASLNIAICTRMYGVIVTNNNQTHEGGGSFVLWYRANQEQAEYRQKLACEVRNASYLSSPLYITIEYTKAS